MAYYEMLKLVCITLLTFGPTSVHTSLTIEEIAIFRTNGIDVTESAQSWTLEHHGVPDHGFEGGFGNNPNEPTEQNHSFEIPKTTTVLSTKGCLRLGPIGMSISGAPFYNPYTGQGKNAVEGDCGENFDDCSGHPSRNGAYHYHKLPTCIYTATRGVPLHQMFLGAALDGYPIYGPLDDNNKTWTSAELDKCHGHTYNGRYMYRITHEFPYIMGCFHGDSSLALPSRGTGQNANTRPNGRPPRQVRPGRPPGQANNPCLQVEASDWMMQTCYAFCETPSDGSYDDCNPSYTLSPTVTTNVTRTPTIVIPSRQPRQTSPTIVTPSRQPRQTTPTVVIPSRQPRQTTPTVVIPSRQPRQTTPTIVTTPSNFTRRYNDTDTSSCPEMKYSTLLLIAVFFSKATY